MILVTGATGTVGSAVARALLAAGAPVRLATSTAAKAAAAKAEGRDAVALDFAKPETLAPALAGAEAVFLLGATLPDQAALETNVVNAAKAAGVKRLVKLSVIHADREAYGFARVHRAVERAIEASGIPHTFLRPNGFMQNVPNYYAGSVKAQGAFYGGAGDGAISHVDVADIAAVAAKALTEKGHEGKAYTITGPEALTYAQVARKLSDAVGKPVSYVDLPPDALKQGLLGAGMPEFYADLLVDLHLNYRAGGGADVSPDVERVTGRKPRTFDAFLKENLAPFR